MFVGVVMLGIIYGSALSLWLLFTVMKTICDESEATIADAQVWLQQLADELQEEGVNGDVVSSISIPENFCDYVSMPSLDDATISSFVCMLSQVALAMLTAKLSMKLALKRKIAKLGNEQQQGTELQ